MTFKGRELSVPTDTLAGAPVVFAPGDRVREDDEEYTVLAGPFAGYSTWYAVRTENGKELQAEASGLVLVERAPQTDTHTHDGVAYDLSASYRDKDGDVWRFETLDDAVRGGINGNEVYPYSETLAEVVGDYGPLSKV